MYCAAIWVEGSLKEEPLMICKLAQTIAFIVLVLCVVSTMAVAAEMTCTKADEKGCTMAKGANGKEMAVMGAGMKMGDKMDCISKDGKTECMKDGMMKK
jgi:hypothetical protein